MFYKVSCAESEMHPTRSGDRSLAVCGLLEPGNTSEIITCFWILSSADTYLLDTIQKKTLE